MRSILQDVRHAVRLVRTSPGFALTAVTILALGLGANLAVFTLISGVMLRPLPYARPDRIVAVEGAGGAQYHAIRYADMLQLRDAAGSRVQFAAVMCCGNTASVVGPGGRIQVLQSEVTANLPSMLGVRLLLGRSFREEENEPGRNRVVLIGEDVWRNLFQSDPQVLGRTLTIRNKAFTIIGVMPKGLSIPFDQPMQIWSAAGLTATDRTSMTKGAMVMGMYARLPDGMSAAQLADQLSRAQGVIAKEVSDDNLAKRIKVTGYQESLNHEVRTPLMLLYAVVFGIWALACLNVTSLLLARAVSRTREQAVRAALGASRMRLLQQSIVESLLLSAIGALVGLLLGQTAIKLLWRQMTRHVPLSTGVHVDWRVLSCMAALALLTTIVVGVFPALRVIRRNVQGYLQGGASTASVSQNRTREALVVVQLAITLVFLVGAGLFIRTIQALRAVPLGFSQENVLTGGIIINGSGPFDEDDAAHEKEINIVTTSYLPLLERLQAMPGVKVAALTSVLPMRPEFGVSVSATIDHKSVPDNKQPVVDGRLASEGLVDALKIPMLRGRFFTGDDTASSPPVIVVNQAFVNRFLPGQDAIGHTFNMGKKRFADTRIVGVIGDMKQGDVTKETTPEIYFCIAQTGPGDPLYSIATAFIQVAIRAAVPADTLRAQFDKALHDVAPDATTTDVKTLHEAVEDSFGSQTLIARLLEGFAALALMIASVGLYGLLSFAVAQRTREIGVRIALGAPQANILSLVLRRALVLVAIGLGLGATMAWVAVKYASTYIYGVKPHDVFTFAAVAVVLAIASFFAALLPARRAASVDPILALRSE